MVELSEHWLNLRHDLLFEWQVVCNTTEHFNKWQNVLRKHRIFMEGFKESQDDRNNWAADDFAGCIFVNFRKVCEDFDGNVNRLLVALWDDSDDFVGDGSNYFEGLIGIIAGHEFDSLEVLSDSLQGLELEHELNLLHKVFTQRFEELFNQLSVSEQLEVIESDAFK